MLLALVANLADSKNTFYLARILGATKKRYRLVRAVVAA